MIELAARQLADEVFGHVEIDLRAGQSDVSEISGEQGKLGSEIRAGLVPAQEPEHGERVTKVVQARTPAAAVMRDPRELERLAEGLVEAAQGRGLMASGTGKEGTAWLAACNVHGDRLAIDPQSLRQIGGQGYEARFAELSTPDGENLLREVDILFAECQQLTTPQTCKKKRSQGDAVDEAQWEGTDIR